MSIQDKSKYIGFVVIVLCFTTLGFGQSDAQYKKIQEMGLAFVNPIKEGKIESLKNITPPKDAWTYSAFEAYKTQIDNKAHIVFGSFIQPGASSNLFGFNFYALQFNGTEYKYRFVAVVNYQIIDGEVVKGKGNYLFTEKKGLEMWWSGSVSHCLNNNTFLNTNPMHIDCAPPPFKE